MTHHLVGASEAASMLAVTRQRLAQLAVAYDDFPAPEAELACGRVWATEAIEAWRSEHLIRPAGPKRRRLEEGLYECFSGPLKRAIALAEEEAMRLEHNFVGTPHLLLGLLREPEAVVQTAAGAVGLDVAILREATKEAYDQGTRPRDGRYPFTPRAKEALDRAVRVAFLWRDDEVRPEHLLLAIAELREAFIVRVLSTAATSAEELGDAVLAQVHG